MALTDALAVRRKYVDLESSDTEGRTRAGAPFGTEYGNRFIKGKIIPYRTEWPTALVDKIWVPKGVPKGVPGGQKEKKNKIF